MEVGKGTGENLVAAVANPKLNVTESKRGHWLTWG